MDNVLNAPNEIWDEIEYQYGNLFVFLCYNERPALMGGHALLVTLHLHYTPCPGKKEASGFFYYKSSIS